MSELLCTETATVMMPRKLTAENGAKAAMSGEFYQDEFITCCACLGDTDGCCDACDGNGGYTKRIPISWTTIKAIYAKAVETLGA